MSLLGRGHRLLDTTGDGEAEMAWNRRIVRGGDDHAADVAETLERVDREDRVHGMKAEPRAVCLDVVGPAGVVVGEAPHDLVRVSRCPEHALPHLGIGRGRHSIPALPHPWRYGHRAAPPADRLREP